MIRRPPRSTLFPTRRSSDLAPARLLAEGDQDRDDPHRNDAERRQAAVARSEEHTSELQSRPHLVCRLLLEKKKKNVEADHPAFQQHLCLSARIPPAPVAPLR